MFYAEEVHVLTHGAACRSAQGQVLGAAHPAPAAVAVLPALQGLARRRLPPLAELLRQLALVLRAASRVCLGLEAFANENK